MSYSKNSKMLNEPDKKSQKTSSQKLVTHNGSFHADDIFAAAALIFYIEKTNKDFSAQGGPASGWEIIRTRDEEIIKDGDYVFDVGGIHDPEQNRFDHHQPGGAGQHDNGIEYASFGLVWKKFGQEMCGSPEVAKILEDKLVSPIDAGDNAISLVEFNREVKPYFIQTAFNAFYPSWKNMTMENLYAGFMECVPIAKLILQKEIALAKDIIEAKSAIMRIYKNTEDKRIIVLDKKYPYEQITADLPEPLFVIYPRADGLWGAKAEKRESKSFENKKDFPMAWAGLRDEEIQRVSGVSDAVFCHRALFLCVAKSKEGAIKLAKIAVES